MVFETKVSTEATAIKHTDRRNPLPETSSGKIRRSGNDSPKTKQSENGKGGLIRSLSRRLSSRRPKKSETPKEETASIKRSKSKRRFSLRKSPSKWLSKSSSSKPAVKEEQEVQGGFLKRSVSKCRLSRSTSKKKSKSGDVVKPKQQVEGSSLAKSISKCKIRFPRFPCMKKKYPKGDPCYCDSCELVRKSVNAPKEVCERFSTSSKSTETTPESLIEEHTSTFYSEDMKSEETHSHETPEERRFGLYERILSKDKLFKPTAPVESIEDVCSIGEVDLDQTTEEKHSLTAQLRSVESGYSTDVTTNLKSKSQAQQPKMFDPIEFYGGADYSTSSELDFEFTSSCTYFPRIR